MNHFSRVLSVAVLGLLFLTTGVETAHAERKLAADRMFTLKDLDGKDVSLAAELKTHKAVLINFWATWCDGCRHEIPDLIRLQDMYKDKGFTIISVDLAESQKKLVSFAKKWKINYPILRDADQSVFYGYEFTGIPSSLLVASDGTVLGEYHSAEENLFADVEKALR